MKNIALGQYYPANSPIHRIDPRIKLIMAILYIVGSFLCKNVLSFAALFLSALFIVILSKIPMKVILGSMKAVIFILLFTVVINIFSTKGETLLWGWKFINIYVEGLYNALFITIRIISMIIGTTVFISFTTTPIMLTDAIESLLAPLKKIKVPVHEFAMMMSIALRFIPTLVDETDKIMTAQKARGADFSTGSLINRAKALIPVLIPLFGIAIRRALELATAMECRCYRGGEGRTKMTVPHCRPSDFLALFLLILFCAGLVALNILGIGYAI